MEIPKEFGGRFVLGERLVERPSCHVYKAADKSLGDRPVAIKIFMDQPQGNSEYIAEFNKFVSSFRAVSHPTLVPVIAGGEQSDWFYLAMEYIEGITLRDYLKARSAPVESEVATNIAAQLAGALKELHDHGLIHGHLDTRAIIFKGDEPRLSGYYPPVIQKILKTVTGGAARLLTDPHYISPEQLEDSARIDLRADVFSLAAILYEMVTGSKPYTSSNPVQLAMARLTTVPAAPSKVNTGISPLLDAAIMKGLAKDPKERFTTMADFIDAVTGGKKPVMNPLAALAEELPERMDTATIAVSMSTDAIKHILQAHDAQQRSSTKIDPSVAVAETKPADVGATQSRPAYKGNLQLDVAATAIGMKADEGLRASFVAMNGDNQGARYSMDRDQVMIGSDMGCDITIAGKNVPARYALIIRRNDEFFAAPLSPKHISVNGNEGHGEEVRLTRGDVLDVGPVKLRFVAPGEVFTLHESVAERVVDRPPNRMPKIMAIVAAAVVVVVMMFVYAYRQNQETAAAEKKRIAAKRATERKELVERLRREGDDMFREGKLIEPVEANARKRFEQIKEIDPEDPYAKRRLAEIDERVRTLSEQEQRRRQFADQVNRLLADGDKYFKAGNYVSPPGANARDSYQEALRLDPDNATAKAQLGEVTRILGDFVGRVATLLARAKELRDQGIFVSTEGDSAFSVMQQVLALDSQNAEAKGFLVDLAARSLIAGDDARKRGDAAGMEKAFYTAQALGVNPKFIEKKLEGIDVIRRSQTTAVRVYRGKEEDEIYKSFPKDPRFLDLEVIHQQMGKLIADARSLGGVIQGPR